MARRSRIINERVMDAAGVVSFTEHLGASSPFAMPGRGAVLSLPFDHACGKNGVLLGSPCLRIGKGSKNWVAVLKSTPYDPGPKIKRLFGTDAWATSSSLEMAAKVNGIRQPCWKVPSAFLEVPAAVEFGADSLDEIVTNIGVTVRQRRMCRVCGVLTNVLLPGRRPVPRPDGMRRNQVVHDSCVGAALFVVAGASPDEALAMLGEMTGDEALANRYGFGRKAVKRIRTVTTPGQSTKSAHAQEIEDEAMAMLDEATGE